VKDINPGAADSRPFNLTNLNGTLIFAAFDAVSGTELWRSDGTAAGTTLVKDINPGPALAISLGHEWAQLNGYLLFPAIDPTGGRWASTGQTEPSKGRRL
jgi:ELWxxDGT repeat protein